MKALDLSKVVRITANVDTTGTGSSLKVEILTAAGYGLDGYTKAHATTIAGMSDTNITIGWATKQLPLLDVQATVIIRAHLTGNAKLYAINLHTDSA